MGMALCRGGVRCGTSHEGQTHPHPAPTSVSYRVAPHSEKTRPSDQTAFDSDSYPSFSQPTNRDPPLDTSLHRVRTSLPAVLADPAGLRVTEHTELGDNASIRDASALPVTPFPNRNRNRRRKSSDESAAS